MEKPGFHILYSKSLTDEQIEDALNLEQQYKHSFVFISTRQLIILFTNQYEAIDAQNKVNIPTKIIYGQVFKITQNVPNLVKNKQALEKYEKYFTDNETIIIYVKYISQYIQELQQKSIDKFSAYPVSFLGLKYDQVVSFIKEILQCEQHIVFREYFNEQTIIYFDNIEIQKELLKKEEVEFEESTIEIIYPQYCYHEFLCTKQPTENQISLILEQFEELQILDNGVYDNIFYIISATYNQGIKIKQIKSIKIDKQLQIYYQPIREGYSVRLYPVDENVSDTEVRSIFPLYIRSNIATIKMGGLHRVLYFSSNNIQKHIVTANNVYLEDEKLQVTYTKHQKVFIQITNQKSITIQQIFDYVKSYGQVNNIVRSNNLLLISFASELQQFHFYKNNLQFQINGVQLQLIKYDPKMDKNGSHNSLFQGEFIGALPKELNDYPVLIYPIENFEKIKSVSYFNQSNGTYVWNKTLCVGFDTRQLQYQAFKAFSKLQDIKVKYSSRCCLVIERLDKQDFYPILNTFVNTYKIQNKLVKIQCKNNKLLLVFGQIEEREYFKSINDGIFTFASLSLRSNKFEEKDFPEFSESIGQCQSLQEFEQYLGQELTIEVIPSVSSEQNEESEEEESFESELEIEIEHFDTSIEEPKVQQKPVVFQPPIKLFAPPKQAVQAVQQKIKIPTELPIQTQENTISKELQPMTQFLSYDIYQPLNQINYLPPGLQVQQESTIPMPQKVETEAPKKKKEGSVPMKYIVSNAEWTLQQIEQEMDKQRIQLFQKSPQIEQLPSGRQRLILQVKFQYVSEIGEILEDEEYED
ncbi:Hypothetical_protein [Hexamita inflata]|uniref:Hypothetical_protein n=1 Tax=Hexamita inflata TaxID=28002 RepID=A0AA86NRP8_9EUKA|nr:Hypothetical protein HINF_LOCUS12460 [Hexamita inflata]